MRRVIELQNYIQKHLDEKITTDTLAKVSGFSRFHCHRFFSAFTGESLMAYIHRLRLERAANKLISSDMRITDIALDAQYEALEAFSRSFKKHFGLSPREYRNTTKRKIDAGAITITISQGEIMDVKIENHTDIFVAYVRHTGPYIECAKAWETLCGNPKVASTFGPNSQFMGLCYDDPDVTAPEKIRYDACVTVQEGFQPIDAIQVQKIEGGKFASVVHQGSYKKLHETYKWLFSQWLPNSNENPKDMPSLEVYLNDPTETPEEDLRTEIRIPLANSDDTQLN